MIYSFLLAFLIPVASLIIKRNLTFPDPNHLATILSLSLLIGLVLSVGPLIYATILRRSFWLKGHSSAGLTHELKSPLATIQSSVYMLLDQQGQQNPDKSVTYDYLHMILRNAERLEIFVQDLLKIAQIQNEAVTLQKSPIDLPTTIQEVADTFSLLAKKKGISFQLQLGQLPFIEGDRGKIQQVISNLISNALKFSDGGTISISTRHNDGLIFCSIADTGTGIPRKHLDRVFDRFFQGNNSIKGSGLGLTIAKAWVEAHGGKIWAESEGEGKGTTVTFTLPVEKLS